VLNRVSIVSFGDREEWYTQAHLAILTALARMPPPCEVVVTTDRPDWYRWFGDRIQRVLVTPEQVHAWSGPQRFIWRVVLQAMAQSAIRRPTANFLYLDVDTLVREPLADLIAAVENGDVFLDRNESPLHRRGGAHRGLWNQVRGRTFRGFLIDERTEIWNSGVVALGAANLHLLQQALELCDAMTEAGVDNWLVEQLSQSLVLRSTGRLREARPWIDHYWGNKAGYNAGVQEQLATILVRGMDVDAAIEYVRAHPIRRPLRVKPRWWQRHFRRLAGVDR
jgi:hypothetical protein